MSSTAWWGTTGRRFQVLYDASQFTGAGVTGPIQLTHLRFRGEDTESNSGGQVYTAVTVRVFRTAAASLSTTLATNLAVGATTMIGTTSILVLTVAPSVGTGPNNWMIDIPLPVLTPVVYDPVTGPAGQVNLLVDIAYTGYTPGPPVPPGVTAIPMIGTQDTTAHGAGVRGAGFTAGSPTATTGSMASPPVLGVQFTGAGGHASLLPARTEYIGASCGGSAAGFYQLFPHTQPFDMAGSGLTIVPDSPVAATSYVVHAGAPAFDASKVNSVPKPSLGDESAFCGFPIPLPRHCPS